MIHRPSAHHIHTGCGAQSREWHMCISRTSVTHEARRRWQKSRAAHLLARVVADNTHFKAHTGRGGVHLDAAALHELQLCGVEAQEAKVVHLPSLHVPSENFPPF